jgi:hypothetical protein
MAPRARLGLERGSISPLPGSKPGTLSIELLGQRAGSGSRTHLFSLVGRCTSSYAMPAIIQCRRQDLNLQASRRVVLGHVCIPFHHSCIHRVRESPNPGRPLLAAELPRLHFRDSRLYNSLGLFNSLRQTRHPGGSSQSQPARLGPAEICRPGRRAGPGGELEAQAGKPPLTCRKWIEAAALPIEQWVKNSKVSASGRPRSCSFLLKRQVLSHLSYGGVKGWDVKIRT